MFREIIVDKAQDVLDILPLYAGHERCAPSHSFGPFVRNEYLLHFCFSGRGTLWDKYGEHKIGAGELFIIRPGEVTTYRADVTDPWHYAWVGFSGNRARRFSTERSVYPCPEGVFRRIVALVDEDESAIDVYTAAVFEILYHLFSDAAGKCDPLQKLCRYVQYNYMKDITVFSIGSLFGYERTYLYRIFRARYGVGLKEYITRVRMENATLFLKEGRSVQSVAAMVGYSDAFAFSKAYKKYYGYPPRDTEK